MEEGRKRPSANRERRLIQKEKGKKIEWDTFDTYVVLVSWRGGDRVVATGRGARTGPRGRVSDSTEVSALCMVADENANFMNTLNYLQKKYSRFLV